ncbi:MAG: hypothetical protein A2751_01095 [Candidatus Doudnabacteria bacterium RIFCSPHIGHO2_01_FULL_46_14]|uniref:Glutamyl-tRNA amidotransferase n=1 Tax=Candidatus Doudnabacteria bacterium RIFCSPHIGHO2_01_FULL_46_14 TaxID=1817824 RepID=A0A1F5NMX8_9BACT|nr:MAG: hypothetical protein A2751_01095 [Candidatus Doudnabacteria bacterium RIFCSPHIGHO2_01_FULL_46_14]
MEKPLKEQIASDIKDAMKQKNTRKISVLRMISAEIKNLEIDKQKTATDEDVMRVLSQSAKKHEDSIAQFASGNRPDLVEQEKGELVVIQAYLPAQLTDSELQTLINESVAETKASSSADFGKVMKILMPKIAGRANGQIVSQKLKEKLS